jgi:hypothetical protein
MNWVVPIDYRDEGERRMRYESLELKFQLKAKTR